MAERQDLPEEKQTEFHVKPTPIISPSERTQSVSRVSEDTIHKSSVVKKDSMGASIQPGRANLSHNTPGVQAKTEPTKQDDSNPSSLHSTSTCTSYSLEISLDKRSGPVPLQSSSECKEVLSENPNPSTTIGLSSESEKKDAGVTGSYIPVTPKFPKSKEDLRDFKSNQIKEETESPQIEPKVSLDAELKQTILSSPVAKGKLGARPFSTGSSLKAPLPQNPSTAVEEDTDSVQEEFYAFVILHDQEDSDEAQRLKTRLESISSTRGATFSEDFIEPGRSTFSCIEEAIENSAYVMLLLTPNFDTHLNETSTDSALMNSIEKPHKYNTVIPLIPQTEGLSHVKMPMVLKTKNPLDETKGSSNFEKMVRKVLDPQKIKRQKGMWSREQTLKRLQKKQKHLQEENRLRKKINEEAMRLRRLEEEKIQLRFPYNPEQAIYNQAQPYGPGPISMTIPSLSDSLGQQLSSINIQNASYIVVGNNSTMIVGCNDEGNTEDEDNSENTTY